MQLRSLDAATYRPHPLHSMERAWPETNCYVDLWIEVLHGLGYEPMAMLGFALGIDFEGDQFTFFKPPLSDLKTLYGVEVEELNIWRSLVHHTAEQVGRGRMPIIEVDAFYLPDTKGLSYRTEGQHPKTSIGVQDIDVAKRTLGYFHNGGYFALDGDDFAGVFHLELAPGEVWLPPYVERVKFGPGKGLTGGALLEASKALTRMHLRGRPAKNPVREFIPRFAKDLPWLRDEAAEQFHPYAFATLRQLGAAFELAASYLRWLDPTLEAAALPFEVISTTCKAMLFKLARTVMNKKPFDAQPMLEALATGWDTGMAVLDERFGERLGSGA